MLNKLEKNKCCGCYSCVSSCPQGAISMENDEEGFWYPKINKDICTKCNICEKKCPVITSNFDEKNEPISYACINKDYEIRINSSSGGVFTLIAEYVINKNGVVFGASFDKKFNVRHIYVDKICELSKLRGSKYVQSNIGDAYKNTEKFLKKGKIVLFTGTPCQVEGLKSYLGKDYENLICQDLICHGVPSPKVWQKYINEKEQEFGSKVEEAYFRNKDKGWKKSSMFLKFKNGEEYIENLNKDIMFRSFLSNICLRPSCHRCSFRKINRISDITLADFWNIDNVYPKMNDDKGISLLIINSKKGEQIFENISENIDYKKVDFDKYVSNIDSLTKSFKEHKNRSDFFREINNDNLKIIVKRYCKLDKKHFIKSLVPRRIKLIVKKIIKIIQ